MNIYILLDRSQSMIGHWAETLGSINGYIETLDKNTNVVLAIFDSISYDVIRNTKAELWENLTANEASPRGGTPLFDSSVRMMWRILDDRPEKAIFVVMTDGEENNSNFFKKNNVTSIVKELDSKGYETVFLGANFDNIVEQASTYGKGLSKTSVMRSGNMGEFMKSSLGAATARYSTGESFDFTDQERSVGVKK